MKSLVTLVVLFTALFVMLDAAPLLPSGFEAAEKQQSDEMAKTFLNIFSKILTSAGDRIGRDGNIQVDKSETRQAFLNVSSSVLSVLTKIIGAHPNDQVGQAFLKGTNSILSAIRKQLDSEDGEQSASKDEVGQTILNAVSDILSAMIKNTDLNDETKQTILNGGKTLFSLLRQQLEDGGEIQSSESDDEMKQAFMTSDTSVLSGIRKPTINGEVHSASDDFERTLFNILKIIVSVKRKYANPNDEILQKFLDCFDAMISSIASGGKSDEDIINILNQFGNLFSAMQKKANPNDEFAQLFFTLSNTMLSIAKNEIVGGQEVHIDTLPYTAKHFDQDMSLKSVDENAAMVEADVDLTGEVKTQLQGAILRSLALGVA